MTKNVVCFGFACTVLSSFVRGNIFATENSTVNTNDTPVLEDGEIVLSKINDQGKIRKIIDSASSEERPSFGQLDWFEDENGCFVCEDKIYDPFFWSLPVKRKLKKISFLKYEEILKIVNFFSDEEKVFVYDFYKNELLKIKDNIKYLKQRKEKVCNFRKILVESFEKRSFFKKFVDFLFSRKKDLSDENLNSFCESANIAVSSEEHFDLTGEYNKEKLNNIFSELSKFEGKYRKLEKQYNKEILKVAETFKKQFPSMKKLLMDFYGKDATLKFDPETVDFKDKNIPKEIKILKNALKILEVDLDKLL